MKNVKKFLLTSAALGVGVMGAVIPQVASADVSSQGICLTPQSNSDTHFPAYIYVRFTDGRATKRVAEGQCVTYNRVAAARIGISQFDGWRRSNEGGSLSACSTANTADPSNNATVVHYTGYTRC